MCGLYMCGLYMCGLYIVYCIGAFTLPTLWIVFFIYFIFACWTYGAGIPSGLFIPCLVIGATYGRFVASSLMYVYILCIHMCMYY